jgi:homoserine O-acetyltransferase
VAIEFADDQINSPEFQVLDKQMRRVKHGRYSIVPASATTRGEAYDNTDAKLWRAELDRLLRETGGNTPSR